MTGSAVHGQPVAVRRGELRAEFVDVWVTSHEGEEEGVSGRNRVRAEAATPA